MGHWTRDAKRLEKLLEDASIKLSVVASNTTGYARKMLGALVAGERAPAVMADMAMTKMRRKIPDLTEALTAHFDEHHGLLVGQLLGRLEHTEQALKALGAHLAERMKPWAHQLELLQTIPGVGVVTAQVFIAETGGEMSRFPTVGHLAAWTGLAPALNESAGKRKPTGTRKGNKFLTSMLVEAANSAARTKDTYLAAQFARLSGRRGHNRAAVAVAHTMLVSAYYMLLRDEPHKDLGPNWLNDERDAEAQPAGSSGSSRSSATPSPSTAPPDPSSSPGPTAHSRPGSARSRRLPRRFYSRVSPRPDDLESEEEATCHFRYVTSQAEPLLRCRLREPTSRRMHRRSQEKP